MPKKYKEITEVVFDSEKNGGYGLIFSPYWTKDSFQLKQFEQFKEAINSPYLNEIQVETYYNYGDDDAKITITHKRPETEEERLKRIAESRRRSVAARKAAETRKQNKLDKEKNKEAEELALYHKLKEKYDGKE